MTLGAPQIIYLILVFIGIGRSMALFGQVKKQDNHDWVDIFFAPAIGLGLLYWGGFFGGQP